MWPCCCFFALLPDTFVGEVVCVFAYACQGEVLMFESALLFSAAGLPVVRLALRSLPTTATGPQTPTAPVYSDQQHQSTPTTATGQRHQQHQSTPTSQTSPSPVFIPPDLPFSLLFSLSLSCIVSASLSLSVSILFVFSSLCRSFSLSLSVLSSSCNKPQSLGRFH